MTLTEQGARFGYMSRQSEDNEAHPSPDHVKAGKAKKIMNKTKKGLGHTYLKLVKILVVMGMDPREMIAFSGF